MVKQYKYCGKLFDKAYCKYNNISNFEFCIDKEMPNIKVNFIDGIFNEFVTIIIFD